MNTHNSRITYEYLQHRKVRSLDRTKTPPKATHIATLKSGIKYFVAFYDECWWIQRSEQYGLGYGGCSLYMGGVELESLEEPGKKFYPLKPTELDYFKLPYRVRIE